MAERRPVVRIAGGLALPLLATVPGLAIRLGGLHVAPPLAAVAFAAAVVGAAFLLTWGTELAEIDIGEGLALALLALIAVLPEYAVDVVFAWKAGANPEQYAPLALANMTGANRLLIGVGWSIVALVAITATRRRAATDPAHRGGGPPAVELRRVQVVERAFLALASAYALTLALRSTLNGIDSLVLFGIFAAYLWRVRAVGEGEDDPDDEGEESELFGPAARIAGLSAGRRRLFTVGMLLIAAAVILAVAEPFADSLVATGRDLHVSEFLLVQWVAPLASETPEFIAVLLLAWKLQDATALGALISSKINQWTLLVGMLPLVFALSAGSLACRPCRWTPSSGRSCCSPPPSRFRHRSGHHWSPHPPRRLGATRPLRRPVPRRLAAAAGPTRDRAPRHRRGLPPPGHRPARAPAHCARPGAPNRAATLRTP